MTASAQALATGNQEWVKCLPNIVEEFWVRGQEDFHSLGSTSGLSCEIIFPSVVLLIQYVLWLGIIRVFHLGERFCHIY